MNPENQIQVKIFSLIQENRTQEARKICEDLLNNYPKSEILYKALGIINFGSREFDLAINFFIKSIKYNADQPEVLNNIGVCYKEKGELKN